MPGKCCMSHPQRYTRTPTLAYTDTHARAKPVSAFVVACFINVCCAKASQVALDAASAVRAVRHTCAHLCLAAQAIACLTVRTIEESHTLCLHNLREQKLQHTRNVEPTTRGCARLLQPPNRASVCHLLLRRAHTRLARRYDKWPFAFLANSLSCLACVKLITQAYVMHTVIPARLYM